ncbi:dipeptidase PepE [Elizabethkingia meningoseptica]|uniref:Dipeptidase E n=1 Tax=Elizabethkingia meningoseptica TaxID=238 RepID=A0A1V3U166_ELIME|nr:MULTISPECIES: dipeptidase PepE [Elizabethkingia]AQX05918.1 dipeptidase E [Elizabethkingia meningoseptica]AQX13456.1 dipeptidase E [Elizabethkingia meningoseptica]AQX47961.1 (alpha)-aspartyl dipeptidase [Elizabethkingia meningoseptica]EJK5327652.1 dipeptidase PepE [Elizabethkingia meningoseptica]EOR30053.1 (alpha)-aspartyl dipeptidase [Elizabethkingia meningoseptica ATCC 13253 = NBRC 12535]
MNILLASTSTLFGGQYLEYIRKEVQELFNGAEEIIFIPFARPGGISHDEYTDKARSFFSTININVKGLHEFQDPAKALNEAKGYFTGGGNTFLLVKTLHEQGLINVLKLNVENGKPYMGASAGSNIGGLNMRTTNDMPIVYPPSFECMGLVPFNINPHYLDPNPELKHNGETRETRILEFLTQNDVPVVGLREGNWIRRKGDRITTEGSMQTRIFEKGKEPYEIEAGSELKF